MRTRSWLGGIAGVGSAPRVELVPLEEVPIRIPGLRRRLDGHSIVQLSDLQIATFIGKPVLRAAEDLVRRARADLIVLTGDLVDEDPCCGDARHGHGRPRR